MQEDDRQHDDTLEDEDENDDEYDDEEDDDDEYTVFDVAELKQNTETGKVGAIDIEKKIIQDLGDIVAVANKNNVSVSMEKCILMGARIDSVNVDVFFDVCVFKEKIGFKNGVFSCKLNFMGTAFEKEADFSGATFMADMDFEDCTFHEEVSFAGAAFEKVAGWTTCEFEGEVSFENASFGGEVSFCDSTFRNKAMFVGATFEKAVDLRLCVFEEGRETSGSNLLDMKKDHLADQEAHLRELQEVQAKISQPSQPEQPSCEGNKARKRDCTRRELLQGVFRFLPEDKPEDKEE